MITLAKTYSIVFHKFYVVCTCAVLRAALYCKQTAFDKYKIFGNLHVVNF